MVYCYQNVSRSSSSSSSKLYDCSCACWIVGGDTFLICGVTVIIIIIIRSQSERDKRPRIHIVTSAGSQAEYI